MLIEIQAITRADIPGAAECIQLAFDDDPYNNWVFDKANFNKSRNIASLTLRCEWGIANALFYVAKDPSSPTPDRVLGVSMWSPPHPATEPESWSATYWTWLLWLRQGLLNLRYPSRGGLLVHRYYIWKARQAEAQRALWTDPQGYYFCNIVTVLPGLQGQGIGRRLCEVVLDRADREGRRCYLESSRMVPNVQIYGKMGFDLVREMRCVDPKDGDGIDLFCMIREPKSRT